MCLSVEERKPSVPNTETAGKANRLESLSDNTVVFV